MTALKAALRYSRFMTYLAAPCGNVTMFDISVCFRAGECSGATANLRVMHLQNNSFDNAFYKTNRTLAIPSEKPFVTLDTARIHRS